MMTEAGPLLRFGRPELLDSARFDIPSGTMTRRHPSRPGRADRSPPNTRDGGELGSSGGRKWKPMTASLRAWRGCFFSDRG